jgi:ABC-type Zn2+ transport system substrate-binding protein/surface adhesin
MLQVRALLIVLLLAVLSMTTAQVRRGNAGLTRARNSAPVNAKLVEASEMYKIQRRLLHKNVTDNDKDDDKDESMDDDKDKSKDESKDDDKDEDEDKERKVVEVDVGLSTSASLSMSL